MSTKQKRQRKGPPIAHQIITLLSTEGRPMRISQMVEPIGPIPYSAHTVHTKALELMHSGFLAQGEGDDPEWQLMPGVTIETLLTAQGRKRTQAVDAEENGAEKGASLSQNGPEHPTKGASLSQRGLFIDHLARIGVTPRESIPSIADIFFGGDITDLEWLKDVLVTQAAGFVSPHQANLTLSWWAKTRQLPYRAEPIEESPQGKHPGRVGPGRSEKQESHRLDLGVGWKIVKDPQGDWVPVPGGPLEDYETALEHAERLMLLRTYGRGGEDEDQGQEGAPSQEGQPRRGPRRESIQDYMMKKMVDRLLDGGAKDDEVKELRGEVARMRELQQEQRFQEQEQRFEKLEGMLAHSLNRDPWDEYDRIQEIRRRLGVTEGPIVTDQSPAVQLIKDTTDKADRTLSRFTGLLERVVLRSGEFAPEESRSPGEREEKAGALLEEAQKRQQSRELRRRTFGV